MRLDRTPRERRRRVELYGEIGVSNESVEGLEANDEAAKTFKPKGGKAKGAKGDKAKAAKDGKAKAAKGDKAKAAKGDKAKAAKGGKAKAAKGANANDADVTRFISFHV